MAPLVEANDLWFRYKSEWNLAGVDVSIRSGTALGIVGESGSGKSTLVRMLCGLMAPSMGKINYAGRPVSEWLSKAAREFRRQNQIVFQNPASSFDPRMNVGHSLAEPVRALKGHQPTADEQAETLSLVGLGVEMRSRLPHELSGGQLQRLAIARALSVNPGVLYADEPTSALDVSVQAQVLNLLMDLRRRLNLTLVMVSHDLTVVSRMCEQIIVMRSGRVVEAGFTSKILRHPGSEYTRILLRAARSVALTNRHEDGIDPAISLEKEALLK
jgi:ABC-type dipeptide/oligopeptide/nickel transport system ATPase subunit